MTGRRGGPADVGSRLVNHLRRTEHRLQNVNGQCRHQQIGHKQRGICNQRRPMHPMKLSITYLFFERPLSNQRTRKRTCYKYVNKLNDR
jgi:hypothetical protein